MSENKFNFNIDMMPIAACFVNAKGKIKSANDKIGDVFVYHSIEDMDIYALTGVRMSELIEAGKKGLKINRNDKVFLISLQPMWNTEDTEVFDSGKELDNDVDESEQGSLQENRLYLISFQDVTSYAQLERQYEESKACICKITIDNFDELVNSTSAEHRMPVATKVDKRIREWAATFDAAVNKIRDEHYLLYIPYKSFESMRENKFSVLEDIKTIETDADFPISLSIGVGIDGESYHRTQEYATAALELALGRGGDQAVVKSPNKVDYYGGINQSVEKSNKGRARVVGHALMQLIKQSDRVFIMGHRSADMDSFGAALGIYRLAMICDKKAHIIISNVNNSLKDIFDLAEKTGDYSFIDAEKAKEMIDEKDVVVVVDTHRASYVDCPEALNLTSKIVVIDHHRRAEDYIKNATLTLLESYASSTAELVTEILQYSGEKKMLVKLEAEALLAGMTIDTNRFAVKTGVRTFEAAAFLRRSKADTTEVKRFFQTDIDAFKKRAQCISDAIFHDGGFATSICQGKNLDAAVIHSQVADELLNVKGVKASFVAGMTEEGVTVISARSLGEVNVQLIMEELGGGGHLTTAGAQPDMTPQEAMEKVLKLLEER